MTRTARSLPLAGTGTGFVADANDGDRDNDGFSDGQEDANRNGALDAGETDPNNAGSFPAMTQKVPAAPWWALVLLMTGFIGLVTRTPHLGRAMHARSKAAPCQ
jgi:hypothetical protein